MGKIDEKRKEAQIVAFYLSKFDKTALKNLGYINNSQAFEDIANTLGVRPNYIKLTRDEFDVVHPYRKGWHKRPISPAVKKVISLFESLDEYSLRSIVIDLLSGKETSDTKTSIKNIVSLISSQENNSLDYISREITGKKAEEYFINWYKSNKNYFINNSKIKDVRTHGCGYDFEVSNQNVKFAIEIKGISEQHGGILFTQKEWEIAEKLRDKYYLIIISNIKTERYNIRIINNPFESLNPQRNIQEIIQVSWTISGNEIKHIPEI